MMSEIPIADIVGIQNRCNSLIQEANLIPKNAVDAFKAVWWKFWPQDPAMRDTLQMQLDILASTPDGTSNKLRVFFDNGLQFISYIQLVWPQAFNDAKPDSTGQCRQYYTPGWTYETQPSGRIVVLAPCIWLD